MAIDHARPGVRVNTEITGEIPHIDGGQSPDTQIPASHRTAGTVIPRPVHPLAA